MQWRVNECCCGCTIRKGTILIGILHVVGATCVVVDFALGGPISTTTTATTITTDEDGNTVEKATFCNIVRLGHTAALVLHSLVLLCSVLLILAAAIEFPPLLLPWAMCSGVLLLLFAVDSLYCCFSYTVHGSLVYGLLVLVCILLAFMVWSHFIQVVLSYYKLLVEVRRTRRERLHAAQRP